MLSILRSILPAGAVRVAQRASQRPAACCSAMRGAAPAAARFAVESSNEYLCTGGAYRRDV